MLRRPALTVLAFHTVLKNVKKAITELKLKVERCSLIIMQIRIAPAWENEEQSQDSLFKFELLML